MPGEIDLNEVMTTRASISIDPEESPEERSERLLQERRQHTYDLVRSYTTFFLITVALVAIGCLCAYEWVFDPNATPETKRLAQASLAALFTSSVSFVLGQATARKTK